MVVSEKVVGPHQTTPRISAKTPFIHNIHVLDSHITLVSESTSSSTIDGDSRDMVDEWLVKEEVAGIAGAASAYNHKQSHQALPAEKGLKYGANAWIHQRDFKGPNGAGCQ